MPSTRRAATLWICGTAALCLLQGGCGPSNVPKARKIQVVHDPLKEARSYLERYVQGLAVGSEREVFPRIVEEIRAVDREKADWLGEGLAEITSKPTQARSIATRLLAKLDE
jgi:hypothetical protein